MSLLMRFPTRRGRKAEGLSTPTMRRPASSLAGLLAYQSRGDQFSPTGVDQHYGSVSTALTSTAPMPLHPAGIVGMPRFRPGVQRRFGADVSTMDTDTPQSLSSSPLPDRRDSPRRECSVAGVLASQSRPCPHCTKVGRTPWGSGVRAVRTTHGQFLPTLGQWEPGTRPPAERSTLR